MNTPLLDYITIQGFKSIANEKVELAHKQYRSEWFRQIKLYTCSILREISDGRLNEYTRKAGGAEQLLFWIQVTERICLEASLQMKRINMSLFLNLQLMMGLFLLAKRVHFIKKSLHSRPYQA